MLAFAVFSHLHGLLLASFLPALVPLCLIYSPMCEIFMCGFYTSFINRFGRSDLSGTATYLTTFVPVVKGKLLVVIFFIKKCFIFLLKFYGVNMSVSRGVTMLTSE